MNRMRKDSIGDSDYELSSDSDSSEEDSEDEIPFEHVNAVQLQPTQTQNFLYNVPLPETETFGVLVRHNRSSNFPEPVQEEDPFALNPVWLQEIERELANSPDPRMGWSDDNSDSDVSEHEELFGPPDFGTDDEMENYFNNLIQHA